MKYIVTDNDNVIIHISETIGYQENGNVLVDNDTLAIAKINVKEVFELEEILSGIVENKYCYTEEKGFYENKNYVEVVNELTEIEKLKIQNESLQEQITNLELALAEIYEENGGN